MKVTRRESFFKAAGWVAALSLGESFDQMTMPASFGSRIDVKVSPPGPKSMAILGRIHKFVGRSNYIGLYGISLLSGQGVYVSDADGNTYLDCLSAASCNVLGYGRNEIARAYYETAQKMQHSCFPYSPNLPAINLAEQLTRLAPGTRPKKALLGLSGSDSCDGAIEAMRKYTGRYVVLKFQNAYHGSTGLSQQVSGFRALNDGIYPASTNFVSLEFPVTPRQADVVLGEIKTRLDSGEIGGVIVEPIQGDAGVRVPATGFLPRLASLLARHQALLIVDEVQSGVGRTGRWWAIEHEGVEPDLLIAGKGMSGGYAPLSALIGRAEIIDALDPGQQLFTYSGHGPSAAAAVKVLSVIEESRLMDNAATIGHRLLIGLKDIQRRYPDIVVDVRGRGLMLGMEIQVAKDPWAGKLFAMRCVEKGLYVGYYGTAQQVIRIAPPLILNADQAAAILAILSEVANEMHTKRLPAATREKIHQFAVGI